VPQNPTDFLDPIEIIDDWAKEKKTTRKVPVFLKKEPEINMSQVIFWASRLATLEEIADASGVTPTTLNNLIMRKFGVTFKDLALKCYAAGKISLRRIQFDHAKNHPGMAIWLGKQWLGQKEPESKKNVPSNDEKLDRLFRLIEAEDYVG
jgi:hypothetical protein